MRYALAMITAASLFGATACTSASSYTAPSASGGASATEGRSSLPTIAGIASANADFSTLVAALAKAGLVEAFDGDRHYTVFAPTNTAFDTAAAAFGYVDGPALIAALDVETLTSILTYHVTLGDRNSKSVLAAGTLRMLDGNWTTTRIESGVATIDDAEIVATDIAASNGLVHVIDAVILPPSLR